MGYSVHTKLMARWSLSTNQDGVHTVQDETLNGILGVGQQFFVCMLQLQQLGRTDATNPELGLDFVNRNTYKNLGHLSGCLSIIVDGDFGGRGTKYIPLKPLITYVLAYRSRRRSIYAKLIY